jgi:hypothetical protein
VTERAAEIREVRAVLQVVGRRQARVAAETGKQRGQRVARRRPLLVYRLEDFEDAAGRELQAFAIVEPDRLAGKQKSRAIGPAC